VEELRQFDAVVLATGGKIAEPDIPGIELPLVCTFEDVLRCGMTSCEFYPEDKPPPAQCGSSVLIWGDHFGAVDATERLAGDGRKVYLVTENQEFAEWMEPCHKDVMLKRFAGGNGEGLTSQTFEQTVTVMPRTTVLEIRDDGQVTLMDHTFEKSTLKVDNVVLAKVEPTGALYDELLATGVTTIRIGDGKRIRNLRAAVREGAEAGLTLDEGIRPNANLAAISRLPTEVDLA
jgi:thioredoxin reductase